MTRLTHQVAPGSHRSLDCIPVPGGRVCSIYSNTRFVYWPIALMLAYVVISVFYIRRSRALGSGTRVLPYAIAGIIVGVALTGASIWEAHHPLDTVSLYTLLARLVSPACAIGLALLVLARAGDAAGRVHLPARQPGAERRQPLPAPRRAGERRPHHPGKGYAGSHED